MTRRPFSKRSFTGVVASFFLFSYAWGTEGISTSFVDVQMKDVPLGQPMVVRDSLGEGIRVKNLGKTPLHVHFQALQPGPADLRGGAVPIPDVHWLSFDPETVDIPAEGEGRSRIVLTVPKDKVYRQKLYQVTIWSRATPVFGKAIALGMGLLSRLRFTTVQH